MKRLEKEHPQPKQRRRRSVAGVVSDKPIALRLKPDERLAIAELAEADNRSMASICRMALLKGLPDLKRQINAGN